MATRRSARDVKSRICKKLDSVKELHASLAQFIDDQLEKVGVFCVFN